MSDYDTWLATDRLRDAQVEAFEYWYENVMINPAGWGMTDEEWADSKLGQAEFTAWQEREADEQEAAYRKAMGDRTDEEIAAIQREQELAIDSMDETLG